MDDLRFDPPTEPKPKVPEKYTLVYRGTLGTEADAIAGAVVFIESRMIVQVNKRSDGTPFVGVRVRTWNFETGEEVGSGTTDADGKVWTRWRPGTTVVSLQYEFPHAYWAGADVFTAAIGAARVVRSDDLDVDGILRISLPRIDAEVPAGLSSCTGFPVYTFPGTRYHESFMMDPDHVLRKSGWNGITPDGARVTRSDTGEVYMLCGTDMFCPFPRHFFLAEDLNRIGEVIGTIEWDAVGAHQVTVYPLNPDGSIDEDHPSDICGHQTEHDPVPQTGVVKIVER
jgi:hypothetical protein